MLTEAEFDSASCAACGRSAKECAYKTKHGGISLRLLWHHDHGALRTPNERFKRDRICETCNKFESTLTKHLGLSQRWSFSPDELRLIIKHNPLLPFRSHTYPTLKQFDVARKCYDHMTNPTNSPLIPDPEPTLIQALYAPQVADPADCIINLALRKAHDPALLDMKTGYLRLGRFKNYAVQNEPFTDHPERAKFVAETIERLLRSGYLIELDNPQHFKRRGRQIKVAKLK